MLKDFLSLQDYSAQTITNLLDRAKEMKQNILNGNKALDILKGKTVVTLFYENSTRTRCSFELAAKYLGAHFTDVSVSQSSVQKGESMIDTAVTIDRMCPDVIVIRHSVSGSPAIFAKYTKARIINAGDGMHAHPTQALLDMFTMREHFGTLKGLEVAIIGDIKHSRVARSNIVGLTKMGAKVRVFAPNTLMPKQMDKLDCTVCTNIEQAMTGVDVVMGLRIQLERQQRGLFPSVGEYAKFYGINSQRLALAKPNAIVMHPGPANRGVEISCELLDSPRCYQDEQVTDGVATRMALLEMLCK